MTTISTVNIQYSINIEYLISRLSASVLQPVLDLRLVLRTGLFEF